jgi:3-hydroxy-9,10-secoandrosta-1,3,5(10)-triene-9,17-dione monooxygenase reductase component
MSEPAALLDARRFRDTVGRFATGVAVIVGHSGDELFAMTANAVMSVSLDPMLIAFCPGKKTNFSRHVASLTGFSINVLRDDQQALSNYFAGGWKDPAPPPFRFVPSRCGSRLEGSLASIDCEPERVVELGDHWLVIGRVLDLHVGIPPHRPLLFFGGRYRTIVDSQSEPAPDLANVRNEPLRVFYDRWGDA